jgi:putative methionine-R-sulfoxide reductase with GAF domain
MTEGTVIVVPIIKTNVVIGVLDINSDALSTSDTVDAQNLNRLCEWLVSVI